MLNCLFYSFLLILAISLQASAQEDRSLAYRFGVFPAQVREALFAVIKNQVSAPGTFDESGWVKIGFYGHQRSIAETYITGGSLYLCTTAFLGLPEDAPFWSDEAVEWTQKKIWSGKEANIDHAYYPNKS